MLPIVRPFREGDTPGIVATVREVFDEYGFSWDEHGYCADLYTVAERYTGTDRAFWVAEWEGRVVGCVGAVLHEAVPGEFGGITVVGGVPRASGTDAELVRLYVRPAARGHRLGRTLTDTVLEYARSQSCRAVELWSDKKLVHAHRMYQGMGAVLVGERICPGDPDQSPEWGFCLLV